MSLPKGIHAFIAAVVPADDNEQQIITGAQNIEQESDFV